MTKPLSEVLACAADLIERPGGWTQGVFARDKRGYKVDVDSADAVCFCAVGAIRHCSGDWSETIERKAQDLMGLTAPVAFRAIVGWNDDSDRKQEEVVAALRAASTKAKEQGQ